MTNIQNAPKRHKLA